MFPKEKRQQRNTTVSRSRILQRTIVASTSSQRAGLTRLAVFSYRINPAAVSLLRRNFHIPAASRLPSHLQRLLCHRNLFSFTINYHDPLKTKWKQRNFEKMLIPTENSATTIVAVLASLNMANKLSRSCTRSFSLSFTLSSATHSPSPNAQTHRTRLHEVTTRG